MLDFDEIAVLDKNALYLGVPTHTLMENAGKAVADTVISNIEKNNLNRNISIFSGLGNNGGDGLVAARYLGYNPNYFVHVYLLGTTSEIRSELAFEQLKRLPGRVEVTNISEMSNKDLKKINLAPFSVIVDAMLGVGITGSLKEPYKSAVKLINSTKCDEYTQKNIKPLIISVDVPTGLGTGTVVKPDITVTFHDSKIGMTNSNSGKILIIDIGIPKETELYIGPGELTYIPKVKSTAHKGDRGRLLIIGGGPYTGAPALAGLAALRTGVDLVHISTPSWIANIIAGYSPNLIVHPLGSGYNYLSELDINDIVELSFDISADALILGPGLGRATETLNAIIQIIGKLPKDIPIVIDADAFSAIAETKPELCSKYLLAHKGVLTPHRGELKLLIQGISNKKLKILPNILKTLEKPVDHLDKDFQRLLFQVASALGNSWTILMKGPVDIITDGKNMKFNRTGNPGMTVGGTGDVLAGITGALLAMGLNPLKAAKCSAFINGTAGDMAFKKFGLGLLATDIIDFIPAAISE